MLASLRNTFNAFNVWRSFKCNSLMKHYCCILALKCYQNEVPLFGYQKLIIYHPVIRIYFVLMWPSDMKDYANRKLKYIKIKIKIEK